MAKIVVRPGRRSDSEDFSNLLLALARFEHLHPPSPQGKRRLLEDIFRKKRLNLIVAEYDHVLVGYALYFYTYSSFLAKPTLYLEDLFVLDQYRKRGVGLALFRRCVDEAVARRCGRMEWAVLDWNERAQRFYEELGARKLSEWFVYRLDAASLRTVPRRQVR
jgi:GNAT superfamily N-acetyltransferase